MSKYKDISQKMSDIFAKHDSQQFGKLTKNQLKSLWLLKKVPVPFLTSKSTLDKNCTAADTDGLQTLLTAGFIEIVPGQSLFEPGSTVNDLSTWRSTDNICLIQITDLGNKVLMENGDKMGKG